MNHARKWFIKWVGQTLQPVEAPLWWERAQQCSPGWVCSFFVLGLDQGVAQTQHPFILKQVVIMSKEASKSTFSIPQSFGIIPSLFSASLFVLTRSAPVLSSPHYPTSLFSSTHLSSIICHFLWVFTPLVSAPKCVFFLLLFCWFSPSCWDVYDLKFKNNPFLFFFLTTILWLPSLNQVPDLQPDGSTRGNYQQMERHESEVTCLNLYFQIRFGRIICLARIHDAFRATLEGRSAPKVTFWPQMKDKSHRKTVFFLLQSDNKKGITYSVFFKLHFM